MAPPNQGGERARSREMRDRTHVHVQANNNSSGEQPQSREHDAHRIAEHTGFVAVAVVDGCLVLGERAGVKTVQQSKPCSSIDAAVAAEASTAAGANITNVFTHRC